MMQFVTKMRLTSPDFTAAMELSGRVDSYMLKKI
jgi:hypothetical protein